MNVSNTTMEEFKNHCQAKGSSPTVDLVVRVLTTGFWPTTVTPKCTIPTLANDAFDCFSRYVVIKLWEFCHKVVINVLKR